jgi:NAD(P)-dependent dehydrogenase (short-subunit alcohol dehydrogenase family)
MPEGLVSVVTGASQGIGQVIARELAGRGDTVVLAARNVDRLIETAAAVEQAGGRHLVVETDVTDPSSIDEMVTGVTRNLGRIDNLVNNSGVGGLVEGCGRSIPINGGRPSRSMSSVCST